MIVRKVAVIITGTLLAQTFGPVCSAHDAVCEALVEPWHIHHELPTGTFRVTPGSAMVSNVSVGISHVKIAANIVSPDSKE
jgi:hypothetical protein